MHKVLTENPVIAPGRVECWGVGRTPALFPDFSRPRLLALCGGALSGDPDLNSCMKDLTIWQRLNTAFWLLIVLLLAGVGLALWVASARSAEVHRSDELSGCQGPYCV